MKKLPTWAAVAFFAAPAAAQNELLHYDGTTEFTSRGAAGTAAKTLPQRIPGDQAYGRTAIAENVVTIQDQNVLTPEMYTLEIRRNNPAGPATGEPDMSAAGLIGSTGPVAITLPGPGPIAALMVTITHATPIALPSSEPPGIPVPARDIYVALAFPPSPLWTADGISNHISAALGANAGEQVNPLAVGYTGVAGATGLGWDANATLGTIALGTGNRSWWNATRFVDDVAQPFADNPAAFLGSAGFGANPNFGYTGMFPDMLRATGPDGVGFRTRATAAVASPAFLIVSTSILPVPVALPGVGGSVCVCSPFMVLGPFLTGPAPSGQPLTTSEVLVGPVAGQVSYSGLGDVYAQGLTVSGAGPVLTTLCRARL